MIKKNKKFIQKYLLQFFFWNHKTFLKKKKLYFFIPFFCCGIKFYQLCETKPTDKGS